LDGPFVPEIPHEWVTANNGRGELVMKSWKTCLGDETSAKTSTGARAILLLAQDSGQAEAGVHPRPVG
jgi:hypothetical protein